MKLSPDYLDSSLTAAALAEALKNAANQIGRKLTEEELDSLNE